MILQDGFGVRGLGPTQMLTFAQLRRTLLFLKREVSSTENVFIFIPTSCLENPLGPFQAMESVYLYHFGLSSSLTFSTSGTDRPFHQRLGHKRNEAGLSIFKYLQRLSCEYGILKPHYYDVNKLSLPLSYLLFVFFASTKTLSPFKSSLHFST